VSLDQLFRSNRTIQKFEKSTISKDEIVKAIEYALLAPNHRYTFPWKYILVGQDCLGQLLIVVKSLKEKKLQRPLFADELLNIEAKFKNPAALLVCLRERADTELQEKEDYASVACAIQNLSLFLTSIGYGTKWGSGGITRDSRTYELLGVDILKYEIEAFLWVGKTVAGSLKPRRRPFVTDVLVEIP